MRDVGLQSAQKGGAIFASCHVTVFTFFGCYFFLLFVYNHREAESEVN